MASRTCSECGVQLSADAPEGLCPQCLLRRGLESTVATEPVAGSAQHQDETPRPAAPRIQYFGDYEVLDEIAHGGMGVVYKARQVSLERVVAIKMILTGQLAGEAQVRRFHSEAQAAANLQHPNIVAIHEVGEHSGQHYFSMDFVEGRDLAQLLAAGPISANRAAVYMKVIAEAIHYAHQRGTIHRDLKPSNVLIDGSDRPRITDFGLAKIMERDSGLTRTGAVMGTASYMPPEQAMGRQDQVGPASDVYSLGAILYEMLTGRPPCAGATLHATLLQVIQCDPPAPRKINPEVPVDLETICLKCLEKDPQRRYSTARALAEDLGRFLRHDPIEARPASAMRRAEHWARRHPWGIAGVVSLVALALLGVTYGLWAETRYLQWSMGHSGFVRAPGARSERLQLALIPANLLWIALMYLILIFRRRSERLSWHELLRGRTSGGVMHPVSAGLAAMCAAAGVLGVVGAIYLDMAAIDARVWEGASISEGILMSFSLLFFASGCIAMVLRARRSSLYGIDERTVEGGAVGAVVIDFNRLRWVLLAEAAVLAATFFAIAPRQRLPLLLGFLSAWVYAWPALYMIARRLFWVRFILLMACFLVTSICLSLLKQHNPGVELYPPFMAGLAAAVVLCRLATRRTRQPTRTDAAAVRSSFIPAD